MQFDDLRLSEPLLRAVRAEGYTLPTPIQAQAIPHVLGGRDLLGCAQTGTGKTAAFALPLLQRLAGPERRGGPQPGAPRALIVAPTRELAAQIGDSFAAYGRHLPLRHAVIFGGVGQGPQEAALRRGVDILVATPGRLLDLMSQRVLSLARVECLVLDEADRMLDMGFFPDVRRIIAALPKQRQTLFFSATMPEEVRALSQGILRDPVSVSVAPPSAPAEGIAQSVYFVPKHRKRELLTHVLRDPAIVRALVFTRTKHGANRVAEHLRRAPIAAEVIHGNKAQGARTRALESFKSGAARVLVATDIAARGIDVDGISHVINFDMPNISESYVHRIGRTARAGASGIAISFCDEEERGYLSDLQRLLSARIPVVKDHPFTEGGRPAETAPAEPQRPPARPQARTSHAGLPVGRRSFSARRPRG